ncbi:SNF2-related protein [Lactococcus insecticola]|uniref:DEAD/DEAH box helicase n=1 Tax=Pseudolactococcus insecticola TaxID=2709158 RepID=A0A6A0B3Y1_9LACT|nr:SNF2-related protein [Lactococcus insecticola]GFH39862.1 DEAD/DEAH box helicase [Lactococcus insecticola]
MKLTDLQKKAIEKFENKNFGALFMDVGTGKTLTAIELIKSKKNRDFCLFITKASLIKQTRKEFEKHGLDDVKFVSYEAIAMSDRIYIELLDELSMYENIFVIADESTALKNESKTAQRCLEIRKRCKYALIMTATPITKDELDLYNQLEFLSQNILRMSKGDFIKNFYEKITYKKKGESEKSFLKFSDVNKSYLQNILDLIAIYGEINIDFEITETSITVEPDDETADGYLKNRDEFIETITKIGFENGELLNFLQFANKTFSIDKNKNMAVADYARNKKLIVFTNYLEEHRQIVENLDRCFAITGATKLADRERIIQYWKESECAPLIIMLGVGGHGLNLQYTDEIVFSSISFDWEKMEQAKGRISRLGQTARELKHTYILCSSPISEMIQENLAKKQGLINSLENEVKDYFEKEIKNERL